MNVGNVIIGRRKSPGGSGWWHDDRGLCDRPHLDDDRRFSIKLEETFDVETVRNDDKCFSIIFCTTYLLLQHEISVFYNSTSLSHAMQDTMSWRVWILKIMKVWKQR